MNKFCKDCKHSIWEDICGEKIVNFCQKGKPQINLVTGESRPAYCTVTRLDCMECGEIGKLWEPKPYDPDLTEDELKERG